MVRWQNATSRSIKLIPASIVILWQVGFAVLPFLVASRAHAVRPVDDTPKVTICHRTDSVTNPYVQISVDQSSVDGNSGNDNGQGDHYLEHTGPVATSEAVAQALKDDKTDWGDIIPPIENVHNGLNWTAEGQAIYNNDCSYVTETIPTGSLKVDKLLDNDANGSFESGNETANGLGFNWLLDDSNVQHDFGTTVIDLSTESHSVNESSITGYHFVGWFDNSGDGSCDNPDGTTLPISVDVTANHTAEITLCNAKDETPPPPEEIKVTLCHRTDSVTNPYEQITVDASAVNGGGQDDHSSHTGPVATSEAVAQALKDAHEKWGDIFPPFNGFDGYNWNADGQSIWNNDCNIPPSPGTVNVTKYNDLNQNGRFDEGEPLLDGWVFRLDNKDTEANPDYTSDPTVGGHTSFSNVVAGDYILTENLKDGWHQGTISCTYENSDGDNEGPGILEQDGYHVIVEDGTVVNCTVGNFQTVTPAPATLTIQKSNNKPNPTVVGDTVVYTIVVTVPSDKGPVFDVLVTDLMPANFHYIAGSWTAHSSVRGDLKGLGITTEPTYHSPGDWTLGNMMPGEVVTLTYQAVIGSNVTPGDYPDIAYAHGSDAAVEGNSVFADCIDASCVEDPGTPFVGTHVTVITNGQVLGASTVLLANTGTPLMSNFLLSGGLLAGVYLIRRRPAKEGK